MGTEKHNNGIPSSIFERGYSNAHLDMQMNDIDLQINEVIKDIKIKQDRYQSQHHKVVKMTSPLPTKEEREIEELLRKEQRNSILEDVAIEDINRHPILVEYEYKKLQLQKIKNGHFPSNDELQAEKEKSALEKKLKSPRSGFDQIISKSRKDNGNLVETPTDLGITAPLNQSLEEQNIYMKVTQNEYLKHDRKELVDFFRLIVNGLNNLPKLKYLTKVSEVGMIKLILITLLLVFAIAGDCTTWMYIGKEGYDLGPWSTILFALAILGVSKFIGLIIYKDFIDDYLRGGQTLKKIPHRIISILVIITLFLSSGVNMHSSKELKSIERQQRMFELTKTTAVTVDQSNKDDSVLAKELAKEHLNALSIKRRSAFISQVLLGFSLLMASSFFLILFEEYLVVFNAYRQRQTALKSLQTSVSKFSELKSKRESLIRLHAEITGFNALYNFKNAHYGN